MTCRRGATLLEVLVAIFVMGIGLITLLTLFPLGALSMARAIQDDRCSQAGWNAASLALLKNIRRDPTAIGTPDVFIDPAPGNVPPVPPADPYGPSYPVLIDPTGYRTAAGLPSQNWVAGVTGLVPRRQVGFVNSSGNPNREALTWFTLLDDLNFSNDPLAVAPAVSGGIPKYILGPVPPNPPIIERANNYSWAYLCQRPRSADPSIVDLAVVVYKNRPLGLNGNLSLNEYAYPAMFDTTQNVVTLDYSANTPPPVRPGDWILDSSPITTGGFGTAHGFFYQVVGVNELAGSKVALEVQQPLRGFPANSISTGTVVVLDGVAAVFEKGLGRPN